MENKIFILAFVIVLFILSLYSHSNKNDHRDNYKDFASIDYNETFTAVIDSLNGPRDTHVYFIIKHMPVVGLSKVCDSARLFYKIFDVTDDDKKSEQWDIMENANDLENCCSLNTFVGDLIPSHHYVIIPYFLRYCKNDLIGVNKGCPFSVTTISSKENEKKFSIHI